MHSSSLNFASEFRLALSPNEAARAVGIGRTTIFGAIKVGALRSAKIGGRRVIQIAALQEWLTAHEAPLSEDERNG